MVWDADELVDKYPVFYHMAHVDSWATIQKFGLLSTTALLDKLSILGDERLAIESQRRPRSVTVAGDVIGTFTIRDQIPLREAVLKKILIDMTPVEWYKTLNGFSFLWPNKDRLQRMLSAGAYKNQDHVVLALDSKKFVAKYESEIRLSAINSGATIWTPPKRGSSTFQPIQSYDPKQVAEIVVPYAIPDILDFAKTVVVRNKDETVKRLWPD